MYETFKDAKHYYITFEYCAGGTLGDILKKEGQFHPDDAELILRVLINKIK